MLPAHSWWFGLSSEQLTLRCVKSVCVKSVRCVLPQNAVFIILPETLEQRDGAAHSQPLCHCLVLQYIQPLVVGHCYDKSITRFSRKRVFIFSI